ncbi:MAG TPA: hypothetical protein VG323_20055 [Thermoanaerobaculia bacterium]|nr:hypothetical protein [Thermoanaerobaculia bacterium]
MKPSVLIIVLLATTLAVGHAENKQPWDWTDDERLAVRLDPAAIALRAAEHEARQQRRGPSAQAFGINRQPQMVIDGSVHPELFLPYELFTCLLDAVDPRYSAAERKVKQGFYNAGLRKFGTRPADFWAIFSRLVARYYRIETAAKQGGSHQSGLDPNVALCRERITLLNASRERFGRTTFDRILYTVVAPNTLQTGAVPGPEGAAGLKYLSGGCQ